MYNVISTQKCLSYRLLKIFEVRCVFVDVFQIVGSSPTVPSFHLLVADLLYFIQLFQLPELKISLRFLLVDQLHTLFQSQVGHRLKVIHLQVVFKEIKSHLRSRLF